MIRGLPQRFLNGAGASSSLGLVRGGPAEPHGDYRRLWHAPSIEAAEQIAGFGRDAGRCVLHRSRELCDGRKAAAVTGPQHRTRRSYSVIAAEDDRRPANPRDGEIRSGLWQPARDPGGAAGEETLDSVERGRGSAAETRSPPRSVAAAASWIGSERDPPWRIVPARGLNSRTADVETPRPSSPPITSRSEPLAATASPEIGAGRLGAETCAVSRSGRRGDRAGPPEPDDPPGEGGDPEPPSDHGEMTRSSARAAAPPSTTATRSRPRISRSSPPFLS